MTGSRTTDHSLSYLAQLAPEIALALPADWRDRLLQCLLVWGEPAKCLDMLDALRDMQGLAIRHLDLEARALAALGKYSAALNVIERRLRRSPAVAAMALEAELLQAAGHTAHARKAAEELLRTYPRHVSAVIAACTTLAKNGETPRAMQLLDALASAHRGEAQILLTLACLALDSGQAGLAGDYLNRLGIGVPANISDEELHQLERLHRDIGASESARAVQVELAHRRSDQIAELRPLLDPLSELPRDQLADTDLAYELLNDASTIPVRDEERRAITLEAARHFGFTELRDGQIETIATVLHGDSILVVMPTGAGKSLCYQLPALMRPGMTLVISPLIALMKDQVENLPAAERRRATFVNSTLSDAELIQRMEGIAHGRYKLVYAAPERLRHLAFLRTIRNAGVSLFVVDEAHCVSLWGHDFRPDYLFLQNARAELGNPPALAMTATAPPRVRDEIIDSITNRADAQGEPPKPRVLVQDVFRRNLHLSAIQFNSEDEKLPAVTRFSLDTPGSGIIYVNTRRAAESLAFALRVEGVKAEAYHAGLDNRAEIQDRFMSGATRVVVATIAFGMGIDKPDIRFIVHFHPPRTLASYYQEVGRAGRDGELSQGVLFYSNGDWTSLRRWATADEYNVDLLERVYAAVASQLGLADGDPPPVAETAGPVDAKRIEAVLDIDETTARVAVSILERAGLLYRGFDLPEVVAIEAPAGALESPRSGKVHRRLCRGLDLCGGERASFKLADVAAFMRWPLDETEARLLDMEQQGLLVTQFERRHMSIYLEPPPADRRERLQRLLAQTSAVSQRRIDDVIGYATSTTCRHGYISTHLGSRPLRSCGVCDICTGEHPAVGEPEILPEIELDEFEIGAMIVDCLISLPKPLGRNGLSRVLAGALRAPVTPQDARHFGALRSLGVSGVVQRIDALIASGLIRQYDRDGFPLLSATLSGRDHASKWSALHPVPDGPDQPAGTTRVSALEQAAPPAQTAVEEMRYTHLQTAIWSWRRRTAAQQNLPPYAIMDNDLILRIAESRPSDLEALAALPGIGAQRLERYGPAILDLVRLHPAQEGDAELLARQRAARSAGAPGARAEQAPRRSVSAQAERAIYLRLQEIRQRRAVADRVSPGAIAENRLLRAIAAAAPQIASQLEQVNGFRSSGLASEADAILEIVRNALGNAAAAK